MNKHFKYLRLFYAPDEGGNGGGNPPTDPGTPAGLGFSGTLIEKTDPVSGKVIKVPVELDSYIGHIISTTRKSIEGQYKPIIEKLEGETAEFGEVKAEFLKLKEASMTVEERSRADAARKISEYESKYKNAASESDNWKKRFYDTMVTNDIMSSFGDVKLCNPEQTAILFRNEGRAEVVNMIGSDGKPTGDFQTRLKLNLVNEKTGETEVLEGTPRELFKRWVNEDRNLHHQINNLAPGAGSLSGRKVTGREDIMKLSPVERIRRAREK